MSCKYSYMTDEFHGHGCTVTGGACAFLIPDSIACALKYQEGPDADKTEAELERLLREGNSPIHEVHKKMADVSSIK